MAEGNVNPFWLTATPLFGLTYEIIGAVEHFKEITARRSRNQNFKVARIEARFFLSNLNNGLNLLSQWLIGISRLQSSIKFQRAAGKQHVLRRAKLRPILAHVACLLSPCH
jgi:hypothetical protein